MNRVFRVSFFFLFFFFFFLSTQPRPIETRDQPSVAPTAPLKNNDFRIYCVLISSLLSPSLFSSPLLSPSPVFSSRRAAHKATRVHDRHFARFLSFFFFLSPFFFINFTFIADYIPPPAAPFPFERKRIIVRSTKILLSSASFPLLVSFIPQKTL